MAVLNLGFTVYLAYHDGTPLYKRGMHQAALPSFNFSRTKGGLGAIALRWNMLAPHRKVKSDFSENFGIYSTLKIIAPSSEESVPRRKIPCATPF